MDERHWWIAEKVQEALNLREGEDVSALLESFFLQSENLHLINSFLQAEGCRTLFFFVDFNEKVNPRWKLHLRSDLQSLEDVMGHMPFPTLLYFLRSETTHEVEASLIEREIFCGEIKENPVESLKSLLNELCIPILRAQKHWGSCSEENVAYFLSGVEKYVAAIEDATNIANSDKNQITLLRRPQIILSPELLQQRSTVLDSELVEESETLVCEWIKTIDQILMEDVDERVLDITTSPLTELERWRRRQKTLGFITDQLRGKECKTVIGLLISAKSRLMKKWKAVDISITDASNATKDRVKYLEALYRHLEALANEHDPLMLINSVLPALFNGIQQMEIMSRFFSRNGYLGLLLTKVSNQLAQNCREILRESLMTRNAEDKLWDRVRDYMIAGEEEPVLTSVQEEKNYKKRKGQALKSSNILYEKIQACMAIHNYFQDALHHLREWLLGSHGMHRYSSSSSISTQPGRVSSIQTVKTNKNNVKKPQSVTSSYDQQHEYQSTGVAITDDDIIMNHLDVLCGKLKQILDIMEKLQEFKILSKKTEGLRKPTREDLVIDDESESGSVCDIPLHGEPKETVSSETGMEQTQTVRTNVNSPGKLHTLIEEDEAQVPAGYSSIEPKLPGTHGDFVNSNNELSSFQNEDQILDKEEDMELTLSNDEKRMLANLYSGEDMEDDDDTLSSVLLDKMEHMIDMLRQYIDTDVLLDTEKRHNNPCEEGYSEFLVLNQNTERYISVYIQALFLRKMPTKEALSILQRFASVSHRQGIKHIINECYLEVFDWFYEELKEVCQVYETFKDDPVLPRNMPPAVGAIIWSRKLLSNIENIMKVFKNVHIVTMCLTYSQTMKLYNRIASVLMTYEDLWYQKWKAQLDKSLSGLSFRLLVRDPVTQQLKVNSDWRIIHLIEETKWMIRLGIQVPEAAVVAFKQAQRFKTYRSNLQDIVQEYEMLQRKIPPSLAPLFNFHIEKVNHCFQPGLSTLTWSSVNIESLLHQANAAVKRLQAIVGQVTEIKKHVIEKTLDEICHCNIFPVDDLITAAPVSTEEFVQLVKHTVLEKRSALEEKASIIQRAFSDIIKACSMDSVQDNVTPTTLKNAKLTPNSWVPKSSRKTQPVTVSTDIYSNGHSEEMANQVLESLNDQLHQAVYTCTYRSLIYLAQLAGCDMERMTSELMLLCDEIKQVNKDSSEQMCLAQVHSMKGFVSDIEGKQLRLKLMLKFKIPHIAIDPSLETVHDALNQVVLSIFSISDSFSWWSGEKKGQSFYTSITEDGLLKHIVKIILKVANDIKPTVIKQISSLSCYDFLWTDNMRRQCEEFLDSNPGLAVIQKEVKRFLDIEQKIIDCPEVLQLGCISLDYSLIKETLKGFTGSWKSHYATILHQQVKQSLLRVVEYRETIWQQLTVPVQSLEQLNSCVTLLEEVQDMENKIDDVYQPIEIMYEQLRSFQLRIPREEVTEVAALRYKWTELLNLTYVVKEMLLNEKADIFRQELDKQVKSFVVEVIQFRNSFDTQGPAAPGVKPEEAVERLHNFKEKYEIYNAKRETLNAVQKLFNMVPKPFSELDRTGKDLQLLGTLYVLFQKFIDFDQKFRNTLWAEVDLTLSNKEVEQYWSECLIWNDKLKDWDAYNEMAREVKFYVDIFPLLHELKSKEIRNRHWLQVMSVTGSSFPLEANVFRISHILDIELLKFQDKLISIAKAAKKEMDFEIKMRKVEEEWSEQVLSFTPYRNKGLVLLVKEDSLKLLEELEDAHILLAQMLTSKEIDPLREEATTWAEKLKRVSEVLELWIDVQELWQNLEDIFSNPTIIKELPREARRFAKVNRSWILMMRSTYKTKNVLQCCCTGDVPKEVLLRHFYQELEICFSSLNSYLGRMRQTFSRFYFLSDSALLSVLSHPCEIGYLQHHFRSLFGGVLSIDVETVEEDESAGSEEEPAEASLPTLDFLSVRSGNEGWLSVGQRSTTHITDSESIFQRSLKSAGVSHERNQPIPHLEPKKRLNAVAVRGHAGEMLQLEEQVAIAPELGVWLSKLQETICKSLDTKIYEVVQEINQGMTVYEWTQKYPTQVCVLGLLYLWTKDCETSISEMKQDRKAQFRALKKYSGFVSKLSSVVSKGHWKNIEEPVSECQRLKLENMIMQILYLRDVMDTIMSQKNIEVSDFDWKRAIRFYMREEDGMLGHEINILDGQYVYGCEFYGAQNPFIMNPISEKCFLKMSQMLQQFSGVVLQGDQGVGKTETVKGLSYLLGKFLFLFTCSQSSDVSAITRVLNGTALGGCWSCFDDFHLLPKNAISIFMHGANALYDSIKSKLSTISLQDGYKFVADPNCSLFLTVSQRSGCQNLPNDVRAVFRAISLIVPDQTVLLKARLTSLGFKNPKVLATRLQLVSELLREQLPEEYHQHFGFQSMTEVIFRACQRREVEKGINGQQSRWDLEGERVSRSSSITSYQQIGAYASSPAPSLKNTNSSGRNKKSTSSNPAVMAAKESNVLIAEALQDIVGPRMTGHSHLVFKQIVGDVFMGINDTSGAKQMSQKELERAIVLKAEENKLFPHSPWLGKVKQLFNLSLANPGVIVAGPPASGKSSCIRALVQALNHLHVSTEEPVHKLVKINPLSVDDDTLMFGAQNQSLVWQDGIITYVWKKAMRNQSKTWIWFDGHLSSSWADNFNSVLGPEKVLQLSNGDCLKVLENMKLVFETTDLHLASPATLTKAGILYIESDAVGWGPLSKVWLEGRNQQEKAVLSKAFYKTLDPIFNLILHETKPLVPVTQVGLFNTCTSLLTVMLNDKAQSIGGQLHIERLFIFCLIWSVGALIESSEKKRFSDLLKVYTSVLPDDDQEISVFDYYLDESGEWDTWQSRLPEMTYIGNTDIMGEVFVETQDTMIVRTFLEYASMGSQHILLTGPQGCGKTALMNDFILTQDRVRTLQKRMAFSGSSKARELQELLEQNIVHRQGFIYGAKGGKTLNLFIDDLSIPTQDENGVQRCNELLRMLLDDKVLLTMNKPFEWRSLESLIVKAATSFPLHANSTDRTFLQRLLRHFAIFQLPQLEGSRLQQVIFSILEANMGEKEGLPLQEELHLSLVRVSCQILESVRKALVPSSTPGRQHYMFSLREISKIFQSLRKMSNEDREDRTTVVSYWLHEMNCVIRDKLCRHSDLNWFDSVTENTLKEYFSDIPASSLQKMFITFPLEMKFSRQANVENKGAKIQLQSVSNLHDVKTYLQTILQHYNEELGRQKIHIELSANVVMQVTRIHRVLSCEHGGNVLLVGSVGSQLPTLMKLALYVANIPLHALDTSGQSHFINSLKLAIQMSAVEGKPTAILLTPEELVSDSYLDAINSLLICGEYTSLFTTEEMNDLLQVLGPVVRRKHPHLGYDPARYLVSQVKSLLRIMVCLPPNHKLLETAAKKYPGFLNGCQIIWIDSWSEHVINEEAKYYIMQHQIMETFTEEIRDKVALAISLIHSYMLKGSNQVPWAEGYPSKTFEDTEKEIDGVEDITGDIISNHFPYCRDIIQERIWLQLANKTSAKCDCVFIGPSTLEMFLDNFKYIFTRKREEQDKAIDQIQGATETLARTRSDAKDTEEKITVLEEDYRAAQVKAADVLNKLITKTSILERLKAELGVGDKTLQIFLSQNENEFDCLEDNDDLLKDDGSDEYDDAFNRMKEASKTSHLHQISLVIDKANSELEDVRSNLQNAKNQVLHWCSKVDKSCIERLVRCQNPPYLVAQILEMALVMVGCLAKAENTNILPKSPVQIHESSESRGSNRFHASPVAKQSTSKRGMRDPTDKVDRARWKNLQYQVGESSKFVEMINQIAKLEDGLPDQTLKEIETYLGRAKEGSHGVTGEGSLLENAAPYATPQSITPAKKYSHTDNTKTKDTKKGEITIAAARYSSEDAATLVAFVVAIVEYTRLCGPLRDCLKTLSDLEREKEDLVLKETQSSTEADSTEEELPMCYQSLDTLNEEDIPALQAEVTQLHEEYDSAVNIKYQLQEELHSHQERLQAALDMLERLKTKEKEWKETLEQSNSLDLLTNCVLAAAFLTYCSPLTSDRRNQVTRVLFKVFERCGLPNPQKIVLKHLPLMQFLHTPVEIKMLEKKGLPVNPLALDNSCILTNTQANRAWTLISDPTGQSIEWIKGHLPEETVEVMYQDLSSEMDTCLIDGLPLLLTYCDVQALPHDVRFTQILNSKREFQHHKVPFKIMVAEHEVECHPGFQLYLHTNSSPEMIPPEVASFCNILYFYQDRDGLVEQLLDRFVQEEKPRLREEQLLLKEECVNNMVQLSDLEGKILATLQNNGSLLHNLSVTKRLGDLKLQHEEATETYQKITTSQRNLLQAREGFREVAVRGAVMFDTARKLQRLNPMYDTSFSQLIGLFDLSIAHSERFSIKGIISSVTSNIFSYISRSLLEEDRMVYALLVAFEVEHSLGRTRPGEREFVISPDLCVTVLQSLGYKIYEARQQAKNPFDWMTEEQFKNVQILAMYYDWFGALFDRMYKDSKDLSWKTFCESEQPENLSKVKWPEGLEELNPLQRLLVLRAVRVDRLLPAVAAYVSGTLGKMYSADVTLDLQASLTWMSPGHPGLLIYDTDSSMPRVLLLEFAKKLNQKLTIFSISMQEDKEAEKLIKHRMAEGHWILLENVQNSTKLMTSLEEILKSNKNPDKNFRLWLSVQASPHLPVQLLHSTVKTIVNMPTSIRSGIINSWQFVGHDTLTMSRRPDWPALLHNFCFLHCATRLRTLYGTTAGWNCPDTMLFGCTEFMDGLQLMKNEFKESELESGGRNISWTSIRSQLSEIIYGCSISDESDMTTFTAMVDYWISSNTTKKDCELTKLKYKVPPAFFMPDSSPGSLAQGLESISQFSLDVPEAFHMHSSPMVPFGQGSYVVSRLNQLLEFSPECKKWPYPTVKTTWSSAKGIKPVPSPSSSIPPVITSTNIIMGTVKLSEVQKTCTSLLSKVPRGWSKDFINDRLKSLGGDTPFNLFIRRELDHLISLLSEVRRNLQNIKDLLESPDTLGDQLSDVLVTIIQDLHYKKAPAYWCKLAWSFPWPSDCTVSSWISDLQQRVTHFDKILQFGREKMPTYWLGAFKNPRGLLSVLKQEAIHKYCIKTGGAEPMQFKSEITQRDKEHIRDPPHEGMFVYGIHIWGVLWNKTDGEIVDSPPKQTLNTLPVIHLQCLPMSEKLGISDSPKTETYLCPVYLSSTSAREPVFSLDIHRVNIASARWALRGTKATIHPF